MSESEKPQWHNWLKDTYRLSVMNDSTYEEKISLRLSPLKLFVATGIVVIVFIILIISLIAFTPLREYIPGYADVNLRKSIIKMVLKTDSLEKDAKAKDVYLANINSIITGNLPKQTMKRTAADSLKNTEKLELNPSSNDLNLRKEIESQDPYSLSINEAGAGKSSISSFFFFTPLKGIITSSFNQAEEHFGVDIVAPENEAIKATLDGTVIFAGWTSETGNVIQLQHANNLVSVYKHNSALMKKTGQSVKAGEVIAIIRNSGENTTGPHLHFELWYNGSAVDPQEYIVF